jgi:hypothetical protein
MLNFHYLENTGALGILAEILWDTGQSSLNPKHWDEGLPYLTTVGSIPQFHLVCIL